MAADAMSKGYARSLDLQIMTDEELHQICDQMRYLMKFDGEAA